MAESTVKKNQLTPTQEGIIAGLVLLFFGFLYWYLNPWKSAEKTTPLMTEQTPSGSVVHTSLANDSTPLAQATKSTATQSNVVTDSAVTTTPVTTGTTAAPTEPVSATASHLAPPPYPNPTETAKVITTSKVTTTETVKPANKAVLTPAATPTEVSKTAETAKPLEATASIETATASNTTTTTAANETFVANTQTPATSTSASIAVQTPTALASSKLVLAPGSAEAKLQSYLEKGTLEIPVNMSDIQFEPKGTKLTKDSEAKALMLAAVLGQYPQANFLITAYTTENSSDTNSDQLSLLRANALGMELVKAGVEGKRITIMGMGNKPPVDKTSAAQKKNQQIEISVIK